MNVQELKEEWTKDPEFVEAYVALEEEFLELKFAACYKQGMSCREIGRKFGRDHHYVKRRIQRQGVTVQKLNPYLPKPEQKVKVERYRRPILDCITCGNQYRQIKDTQTCCSRPCFEKKHSRTMSGEKNPAYIDGRSKDYNHTFYRGEDWDVIKHQVYERDNWTCQKCGVKCVSKTSKQNTKRIIQCHHVVPYPEGDNSLSNLETVCLSCHRRIHHGIN